MTTTSSPTTLHRSKRATGTTAPAALPPSGRPAPDLGAELAGARLLRISDVSHAVGLSSSQIYQLITENAFPAPIKLSSRCSRWRAREVHAWLEALQ